MDPRDYFVQQQTRRTFFKNTGLAAGRIGLASLMFPGLFRAAAGTTDYHARLGRLRKQLLAALATGETKHAFSEESVVATIRWGSVPS